MRKNKVFVGLSGGVDSSVAALLLQKQGYDVTGIFMRCLNLDGCAEKDAEDARRVASHLGIPFYVFDFEEEYKKRVVEYMIEGYKNGSTPNPDVMCNKEIKFDLFLREALKMGANFIATGHYVKLSTNNESNTNKRIKKFSIRKFVNSKKIWYSLMSARDSAKDQSYFLWTLTQNQLKHCLFPIGDYLKPKVREIARKAGLPTADKKDSQGICFLGSITLEDFLKEYIPQKPGNIVNTEGKILGTHNGIYYYTIGHRHGLDLREKNKKLRVTNSPKTKPHYITAKDLKTNTITVAEGDENPTLYRKELILTNVHFINPKTETKLSTLNFQLLTRIRYRQPLVLATLHKLSTLNFQLIFESPQKAIASGQSAVFYSKQGELLGGGIIL